MKTLNELVSKIKEKNVDVEKRVILAGAEDLEALKALKHVYQSGICEFTAVGKKDIVEDNLRKLELSPEDFEIVDASDEIDCAEKSVRLVNSSGANLLMKGLIKTSTLLKAVLNEEWGLRTGKLLSHIAVLDSPVIDRLILLSDGGMIIKPTLEQKISIIENAVQVAKKIGINEPKVACIAAVEVVNSSMPETIDAAILSKMNQRGQIKGCIVEGPLGFDNAIDVNAAKIKKISGEVAGRADILIVPDIHSGNFLGKSVVYMAGGNIAGIVFGAKVPIVIVSRADSFENKFYSIVLGLLAN
ncbi:MAG TPA: bifunctional enoyl-CoA hydratase/phosphate acetyltransferase [Thermotogaceae bacterium]|nr:bifunctional enoyl-CoA hydratase/phosphate acetyltransferase [Thermotogaceae bacterium]